METESGGIRRRKSGAVSAEDLKQLPSSTPQSDRPELPRAGSKLSKTLRVVNEMVVANVIGRYAIGGAVAATFYLEPVTTMDVDVFVPIHAEAGSLIITASPIYEYLTARGYQPVGEALQIEDWLVQFLPPTSELVEEAIATARQVKVGADVQTFVMTAEHLIAIALQTGRPKDMTRIVQFIDSGRFDEHALRVILERHGLVGQWEDFQRRFVQPQ